MYKLWLQQNSCHLRKRSKKKETGRSAEKSVEKGGEGLAREEKPRSGTSGGDARSISRVQSDTRFLPILYKTCNFVGERIRLATLSRVLV